MVLLDERGHFMPDGGMREEDGVCAQRDAARETKQYIDAEISGNTESGQETRRERDEGTQRDCEGERRQRGEGRR